MHQSASNIPNNILTLKTLQPTENKDLPSALEQVIGQFIDHHSNHPCQESLNNVTSVDAVVSKDVVDFVAAQTV